MDATQVINDYMENPEIDFDNLGDLIDMAQDYQYQLLMSELPPLLKAVAPENILANDVDAETFQEPIF